MKKVLVILTLTVVLLLCLASCMHEHSFGEWSVIKNATCTEDGVKSRYCDCGEKDSDVIPANGHKEQILSAKEASCIETGLTEGKKCLDCYEILVAQQETPVIAHTYDDKYDDECNVCGHIRDAECAHAETEVVSGKAATCTATGLTDGSKCKKCGEVIVAQTTSPVAAHTETAVSAVDATCVATGLTAGTKCSVCSKTLVAQREIPKIAHTYDDKYDESCNKCGFVRDAECAHIETITINGYDATCTATGLTDGMNCKKCGEILVEQTVISMKPHTEAIDSAVAATCTSTGLTEGKHCSVCSKVLTAQSTVPMKPHTEAIDSAVAPTCTSTGLTEGKHCSVCRKCLVAQESIPALGHSSDDITITSKNCINDVGQISYACDLCSEIITKTISDITISINSMRHGNTFSYYYAEYTVSAKGGYGDYQYKYEVYRNLSSETAELIDNYSDQNTIAFQSQSSLTDVIIKIYIKDAYGNTSWARVKVGSLDIIDCGVEAGGHEYNSVVTAPTKTESGYTTYTCTECGDRKIDNLVPPTFGLEYTVNDDGVSCTITGIGTCTDTEIVLPTRYDGYIVTNIGQKAFYSNQSIVSFVVPDTVLSIEERAFYDCSSIEKIALSNSLTSIGNYAFGNCASLENIIFEGTIDQWQAVKKGNAWDGSRSYTYNILCLDGIIPKGGGVIRGSYGFEYVSNGDGTCYIGSMGQCTDINVVIIHVSPIGEKVVGIGDRAFEGCKSITRIKIADSVTNIGEEAFKGCESLAEIILQVTMEEFKALAKGNEWDKDTGDYTIYCTDGAIAKDGTVTPHSAGLKFTTNGDGTCYVSGIGTCKDADLIIPPIAPNGDKVVGIGDWAFEGCERLKSVVITDGVKYIGYGAFAKTRYTDLSAGYDTNLESVVIGSGVEEIARWAFRGCLKLANVTFKEGTKIIGEYAFWQCRKLTTVNIPNTVEKIESGAFEECKSLTTITIPASVRLLDYHSFRYCTALTEVSILSSSITVGSGVFSECTSLSNVYMVEGITVIGASMFKGCSSLTSIEIPNSVTEIVGWAFLDCSSLKTVSVGTGLSKIGDRAFYNTKLTEIINLDTSGWYATESYDDYKKCENGRRGTPTAYLLKTESYYWYKL